MKIFRPIALFCFVATLASCEDSEILHTTSYPIVRVEASTTITPPKPETSGTTTWEPTEEDKKLMATINTAVLDSAPMASGGSYTLDFTRYNGGILSVTTAADTEQLVGRFDKVPGKGELSLFFGEQTYTTKIGSYTDEAGKYKVLLMVDLTSHYQTLYPDAKLASVTRNEYTSTPSK